MGLPEGLILGIESSNPSSWTSGSGPGPGVAMARFGVDGLHTIGVEPIELGDPHRDDLMTAVERLAARSGVRARDVRGVAVSVGPGGFTAVRIAVTAAKMIAEVTGALAMGVPSAWVVARRFVGAERFGVALASKGDTAWVTVFDGPASPAGDGGLVGAGAIKSMGVQTLVADSYLPDSFIRACREAGIGITAPVVDPLAVIEAAAGVAAVDPVVLAPIYPREPEAVTKWRAMKAGSPQIGPG